mmetsp:Transcript_5749/g.13085  ORF Transcript_5749/g.13085 Transcript_5749/m.13085 type:complete len:673 (-) Transcript_5749:59-2077(-)
MAKKRFTSHDLEEEEMPSLINSDSSRGGYDQSPRDLSDEYEDDHSDFHDEPIVQRRHTDAADGSNISSSISPPPPPPRQERQRSRSRPRTPSRRGRFSYSRRSSLGGTTIYRTPHMATLDTHLRSTSGLRLQTDGTCNFLFEQQRFVIETTEETGDFLFYANFGPLKELQRTKGPRHLLRLLALWNEELKQRDGAAADEGHENSGLLRIDSSKPDGPHVAFIYYGHVDEIENAQHFQDTMDEFVDDALEFSDKLNGIKEQEHLETAAPSNVKSQKPPSSSSPGESDGRSKFNMDAMNNTKPIQEEAATLAATTSNNNTDNSTSKKSVFTKMISSLRSKSNDIGSHAFVDPSNSMCAFVVDKNAAIEGNIKPTINLSRKGVEKKEERRSSTPARKGSSFHNRTDDNNQRDSYPRQGRSFHAGDDYDADANNNAAPSSRRPQRKHTSFSVNDYDSSQNGAPHQGPKKPHRKSTSSTVDDYSGRRHNPRQSTSFHLDNNDHQRNRIKGSSSFHIDDRHGPNNYPTSKAKSKSFHRADRKRSSYVYEESDDYESSNKSIDIYEKSRSQAGGGDTRFLHSEPTGASRRRQGNDDYPEPHSNRCHSRRHSSVVPQHSRRAKNNDSHPTKRHSVQDERSMNKGSHRRHSSRNHNADGRMNQSEPILSHQRNLPPPPPFM